MYGEDPTGCSLVRPRGRQSNATFYEGGFLLDCCIIKSMIQIKIYFHTLSNVYFVISISFDFVRIA